MAVKHSSKWHAGRLDVEQDGSSNPTYASGSGVTAFAQTKLSALAKMPYPRSYSKKMYPSQIPMREKIESNDDGIYGSIELDAGWKINEGSREDYVQESFYLDKIISQIAALQGSVPISYALHWQDHIRAGSASDTLRYESFGCYLKSLGLVIPKNDGSKESFPYWKITDSCYSTKYEDGAGTDVDSIAKVGWILNADSAIATKASFTIGGNAVNNIEGELTINLLWDEEREAGDDGLKYPYFLGIEIEFTAKFRSYTEYKTLVENLLKAKGDESLYTIKITSGLAACFPQITNMAIREGDFEQVESIGVATYDLVFKNTSTSVLTKEAS